VNMADAFVKMRDSVVGFFNPAAVVKSDDEPVDAPQSKAEVDAKVQADEDKKNTTRTLL
jgi:hypothetical protein